MVQRLFLFIILAIGFKATMAQTGFCDTMYWNHTYSNQRLLIYDSCYTVTGIIKAFIPPIFTSDGDYHIYIHLDTIYSWMNTYRDSNFLKHCEGSDSSSYRAICSYCLNVEEVCKGPIVDGGVNGEIESNACLGFNDTVYVPNIGEYVQATGPFIYDTVHCWNELHPISKMVLLPKAGITELIDSSFLIGMKIFPIPAKNQVSFQFQKAPQSIVLIKIFDGQGRQLYVYAIEQTNLLNVDVSSWPSGNYLYTIISQDQHKTLNSGKFNVLH